MKISKFTNNVRYLYRESECLSWQEYAEKYGLNYKVLNRWMNREDEPPTKSLQQMSEKLGVSVEYLQQEREELTLYELDYWHHAEEHKETRYTLSEFYNAYNMVAEDPHFDHDAFERVLHDNHYSSLKHGRNLR